MENMRRDKRVKTGKCLSFQVENNHSSEFWKAQSSEVSLNSWGKLLSQTFGSVYERKQSLGTEVC